MQYDYLGQLARQRGDREDLFRHEFVPWTDSIAAHSAALLRVSTDEDRGPCQNPLHDRYRARSPVRYSALGGAATRSEDLQLLRAVEARADVVHSGIE